MTKKILSTSVLSLFISSIFAQSLELRDVHGGSALINGTTITVNGSSHAPFNDVAVDIEVTVKDTNRTIKVTKKELFYGVSGMDNAICLISCSVPSDYGTNPVLSTSNLALQKDSSHIFNGHVYPNALNGQTKFRYVFYDVNRPNDTAFVDVIFDIYDATSVNEIKNDISLKTYPNPVNNGELTINISPEAVNNTNIVMIDILGKVIYSKQTKTSVMKVNTSSFKSGVYFVSVRENGEILKTQKIIVSNQ